MASREENLLVDLKHSTGDFEATASGDLRLITGRENLNQAIFHRLITVPGTLTHKPGYGVGIQNWQGQLNTLDNQRLLALDIRDQLLEDPRVDSVDQVQFIADDLQPDLFKIFVKYTASGYNELEETFDPFQLGV